MTEEEIKLKEKELFQKEVYLNIRERDLRIYEGRVRRAWQKLFPGTEFLLRDL